MTDRTGADEDVEALVKQIKDASAILADWAEEDAGFSSVDIDEARAEILSAAELLASRLFVSVEGQAAAEQRAADADDAADAREEHTARLVDYVARSADVFRGIAIRGGDVTVRRWCDSMEDQARALLAVVRAGEATEEGTLSEPGSSAAAVDGAESPSGPRGHHEAVGERQGRQPGSLRVLPARIGVDADGYVWRDFGEGWLSMAPSNSNNEPVPEPITWFYAGEATEDPECSACGSKCLWADDAWVCQKKSCGAEWYPDHGHKFSPPGEATEEKETAT